MSHKAAVYSFVAIATLAVAAGYTQTSQAQAAAQAGAAQAPRPGRGGNAGDSAAPARKQGDGVGPFKKMVIRGVTVIDGTGGPPLSPMDIVIEGNRITSVRQAGWPGLAQQTNREPRDADYEIDGKGMYVMPGFVDVHVHGAGKDKAPDLSYSYKLWLAHGVTTVRGVSLSSAALSSSEKNRSAKNEIVAPRIFNYQTLGSGWAEGPVRTPEKAREYVRWAAANNIDGIKFFNRGDETPEIDTAAIDEAHKNKMGTVAHLSQNNVAMFNARIAGDA
ncbi:MAG: amidohydrolase, partial [Acidobacteria bacterium]|nr:amidohydrolase [Acidobacteriota bacterium]